MKKFSLALLAAATALAIAPAAFADTFDYTINGTNFKANLVLNTGAADSAGVYTVSDVSGNYWISGEGQHSVPAGTLVEPAFGATATSLHTSVDGQWLFDNLLYPSNPAAGTLDWGGILFEFGGYELNLFGNGTNLYFGESPNYVGDYQIENMSATLTKTPEPSSLLLLGTAMLGLAFVAFRKSRHSSPVFGNLA